MSTVELDVPSSASSTPPIATLRSPLGSPRHHKRHLTLSPSSSIASFFSSVPPITPTRQTISPATLSNNNTAASSSPWPLSSSSLIHSSSLRSLYRRISSRLPSSDSGSLNSSSSTPLLMSPSTTHKASTMSPLFPVPFLSPTSSTSTSSSSSPTAISTYPSAPLPVSTLRLLVAHSTYLATVSTHMSMLSSFLYLVLNLLKSSYHSYRHSVHVVVWCDVLLVAVNVMGVCCAMGYWCSYAERRRYEWEWDRRRTGKAAGSNGLAGVEGEGLKQVGEEDVDEEDIDITEGEVQSLLMQHSPTSSEEPLSPPSAFESPSLPSEFNPLGSLVSALQHLCSAFTLTLFYSQTFYVSTVDGVTELLSLCGAFLYLLSSLFPLVLDTHIFALQEETEATLDEVGYAIDSLAMTLFVVSSLLYLRLYYRDRRNGDAIVWLDGGFWSNLWNVGGAICYLFAIGYGLSIRLHMSAELSPSTDSSSGLTMQPATMSVDGLFNGSMADGTVEADDLSDLSEWQRALFGLRSGEKLMTCTGDLMYMMCAVMMEIAERQSRRRRIRGRKVAGGTTGVSGSSKLIGMCEVGMDDVGSVESATVLKRNGKQWSDSETPGLGVGVIDVLAT